MFSMLGPYIYPNNALGKILLVEKVGLGLDETVIDVLG